MKDKLEQTLKQNAEAIKAQAQTRLQQTDFSQSIEQRLKQQTNKPRVWWYGMAAAVSLTVISWLVFQQQKQTTEPVIPVEMVSQPPVLLNLQQIPITIEHKVNQPLIQEQQAIFTDLKRLKAQLLSI